MTIQHDWHGSDRGKAATVKAVDWSWPGAAPRAADSLALRPHAIASRVDWAKRLFDIVFALLLLIPLSVLMLAVAVLLAIRQGRPILYAAPRMKSPTEEFTQWKFRTMACDSADSGASGAHKNWRITRIGRVLRRTRIDELPQLFNILRGDMSFVGPRPPLREYVDRFPLCYARTLQSRPGVTGLATLIYHRYEDRIMAACETAEATEAAYYRRCLPMKFRIDTLYQQRHSLRLDLWIIWQTVMTVLTNADVGTRKRRGLARARARRRA
ncbi:sugar transferase [Paracoccus suum]|uniref:Sugar transferase n=1 Tax=Paracoccus suum TaxID=2259340 RepID=A0A344PGF2_9RHOB|nr:sugar transferase [Paracoccus suum]